VIEIEEVLETRILSYPIERSADVSCFFAADSYFAQDHPAEFETSTSGYNLLSAGAGADLALHKNAIAISLAANNILNKYYYDHLSRFKEYGIHNIGRNIVLNIHIPISIIKN
jgi:iron complex outermembrane receptor protein